MFEALADQMTIEASEFSLVGDRRSASEAPFKCRQQERIHVDLLEDFVHGARRHRSGNAGLREALMHPRSPTAADACFGACNRSGHTCIVNAAALFESLDRRGNRTGLVAKFLEASANLRLRELSAGEHLERSELGRVSHVLSVA